MGLPLCGITALCLFCRLNIVFFSLKYGYFTCEVKVCLVNVAQKKFNSETNICEIFLHSCFNFLSHSFFLFFPFNSLYLSDSVYLYLFLLYISFLSLRKCKGMVQNKSKMTLTFCFCLFLYLSSLCLSLFLFVCLFLPLFTN